MLLHSLDGLFFARSQEPIFRICLQNDQLTLSNYRAQKQQESYFVIVYVHIHVGFILEKQHELSEHHFVQFPIRLSYYFGVLGTFQLKHHD